MSVAYSYLRFSTGRQSGGDTARRQLRLAEQFAQAHGLALNRDFSFRDKGVSAFRGQNLERGSLRDFRRAVEVGLVSPGSWLLIESLDRFSRLDPWTALPAFQEIINAGITVVTLQDERVWTREELRRNPWRILESLIHMIRAREESELKSARVRASRELARAAVRTGARHVLTAHCPGWLRVRADGAGFDVIEEHAVTIRTMFELASKGHSCGAIARALAFAGRAAFQTRGRNGRFWHRDFVRRTLTTRAVLGEFTPHVHDYATGRLVRVAQPPLDGYFPPIIDPQAFKNANASLASRPSAKNQLHFKRPQANALARVARCGGCGGLLVRMARKAGGERGPAFLVCARAHHARDCDGSRFDYAWAEAAALRAVRDGAGNEEGAWVARLEIALGEERDAQLANRLLREQLAGIYIDAAAQVVRIAWRDGRQSLLAEPPVLRTFRRRR